MMVKEAARSFFAGLYAPGGRLGYEVTSERRGVSADDIEIARCCTMCCTGCAPDRHRRGC